MSPSCRILPMLSSSPQKSTNLPSSARRKNTSSTSIRLPVGVFPRNSPKCVPEQRKRPATVSPSATSSTISSRQSGKAERNSANNRFTLRAALGSNSSPTASASPPALMASTRRRTMNLICSDTLLPPLSRVATLSRNDTQSNGRCLGVERLLIIGGLFVVAGLCEIVGGYLVWGWMREHKPLAWALLGALVLAAYGVVAALQPISEFGRVYAAYGGVFIALSLAWGIVVDGFRPDRWDLLGALVCVVGVVVMVAPPRS